MVKSNYPQPKKVGYIEFGLPDWISPDVCGLAIKSWSCLVWRVMVSLVRKLHPYSLGAFVSRLHRLGREEGDSWRGILRERLILSHLVSGSPMMWLSGVEQVLHQCNQPLDGESGCPDYMEMSYWHPLSSLNMCWHWKALDLSWRVSLFPAKLHGPSCRTSSLWGSADMCHWNHSIDLLSIVFSQFFFVKFWTRFKIPCSLTSSTHSLAASLVCFCNRADWRYSRLKLNVPALLATTHTCPVTLMEMTEVQESLEVSALAAFLPLGNVCYSARRKCHSWFVSTRCQCCRARPRPEHMIRAQCAHICYTLFVQCRPTPKNAETFPVWSCFLSYGGMAMKWVHTALPLGAFTRSLPETRWWRPLKSGSVHREKHRIREREAELSCVSFQPI